MGALRVSFAVGADGEAKASLVFGPAPLFPVNYEPPTDQKEQVAHALEYALDALVQERPADALAFCSAKLKEYDEKYLQ